MRGTARMDPVSSKFGCVLLMLLGTTGVPLVASGARVQPEAVMWGLIAALLVVAGMFGFMICLKNEAVAEVRVLIHELQSYLVRIETDPKAKGRDESTRKGG